MRVEGLFCLIFMVLRVGLEVLFWFDLFLFWSYSFLCSFGLEFMVLLTNILLRSEVLLVCWCDCIFWREDCWVYGMGSSFNLLAEMLFLGWKEMLFLGLISDPIPLFLL